MYVLLMGCNPLRIYLFNDGLVRICTIKYKAPKESNYRKTCMHLTNYAINKNNKKFVFNNNENDFGVGNKRSLKWFYN